MQLETQLAPITYPEAYMEFLVEMHVVIPKQRQVISRKEVRWRCSGS